MYQYLFGNLLRKLPLPKPIAGCEDEYCDYVTTDSPEYLQKAEAVIFDQTSSAVKILQFESFSDIRQSNQRYIFMSQESAIHTMARLEPENFYNWTMTYRSAFRSFRTFEIKLLLVI